MRIGIGVALPVGAIAVLVLAALHLATPSGASPLRDAPACGGDRWHVRTLQDRPKLLPTRTTTLAKLFALNRPRSITPTRMPIEHRVVTLVTGAQAVAIEHNREVRVRLIDPNSKVNGLLFAFVPAPVCASRATAYRRKQMGIARQQALYARCFNVQITGVLFFSSRPKERWEDRVQLRPVLGFKTQCE